MSDIDHLGSGAVPGLLAATATQRHDAGARIEQHCHDEHQIVYPSRGAVAVTTSHGTWLAPLDRAIWIPAGVVHEHRFYGATHFHCVGFDPSVYRFHVGGPVVVAVTPLLRELIIAAADGVADAGEAARLRAVLVDRLRHTAPESLSMSSVADPRLVSARNEIEADLATPLDIGQVAARIGVGARTLSRLIRSELGRSYPQWRTQLRLHHAIVALVEGRSVTETAIQCGWPTASAFIDTFRRAYGRTPGTYADARNPASAPQ